MAIGETAALVASLQLNTQKFDQGIGRANTSLKKLESTSFKVGQNIGTGISKAAGNIKKLGLIGGGLALAGLTFAVKAASDLNEQITKTQAVFKGASKGIIEFANTASSSLGIAKAEALEAAGQFGTLFVGMGLGVKPAAAMSAKLVVLASDLASFNNIDPSDALEKLRAGLVGEAEPLRSVGILLNEQRVVLEAVALGLVKVDKKTGKFKGTLTEAQKVQARYSLILKDSKLAQGDFGRTSEGLANQMRILKASLTDTGATIGTALLPNIAKLAQKFNTLIKLHAPEIQKFADALPPIFDKLVAFFEKIPWDAIKDAFLVMGVGARALLDAFLGLPPWVQTAVITGWGLNKLTGGAVTNIIGTITEGLGKNLATKLGLMTVQAGTVNVNGPVTGGGGGAGGGPSIIGVGFAAALGLAIAAAFKGQVIDPGLQTQTTEIQKNTDALIAQRPKLADLQTALAGTEEGLRQLGGKGNPVIQAFSDLLFGGQADALRATQAALQKAIDLAIAESARANGPAKGLGTGKGSVGDMETRRGAIGDALFSAEFKKLAQSNDIETLRTGIEDGLHSNSLDDAVRSASQIAATDLGAHNTSMAATQAGQAAARQTFASGVGIESAIHAIDVRPVITVEISATNVTRVNVEADRGGERSGSRDGDGGGGPGQ